MCTPELLATQLADAEGVDLDHTGRVRVNLDNGLPGHPDVFVMGDIANLNDLPGLSEPALPVTRRRHGRFDTWTWARWR